MDAVSHDHQSEVIQPDRQEELGQFLTPEPVARFMASLFQETPHSVRLLDAGAGAGALTEALIHEFAGRNPHPGEIAVTAYEMDESIIPRLQQTLSACKGHCARVGISFSATIHNTDFIAATTPTLGNELFAPPPARFNAAIVNPPYRKIRSDSATRLQLRSIGIETSNLYTGFLSIIMRLLEPGAELVAITPRSFCNGPYFRPFREELLKTMSLRQIHVFESRSAAFDLDGVLQENIIFRASKSPEQPKEAIISTSSGHPGAAVHERRVQYAEVISPADPEKFIHLVGTDEQAEARNTITRLHTTLLQLGLSVSTGRVVDFRAQEFLRHQPASGTVPLIYPCHFNDGFVHWPKLNGRKPNAIVCGPDTQELLIPAEIYVLVKRFTSKEERRRIVACIYDPSQVPGDSVGFENHLNYFHINGHGLPMTMAKGLAVFLNSTVLDSYFRQFNGHTQVNATDLRNLRYPTNEQLLRLGRTIGSAALNQETIDDLLSKELNATPETTLEPQPC